MKPKIFITHKTFPETLEFLSSSVEYEASILERNLSKDEIISKVGDIEGLMTLLVDPIDKDVINAAPSLKVIANCAAGYNNIDVSYAKQKKILVTNTPGILTEATADLTWALILAVARRIPEADRFTREGRFDGWKLNLFLGKELSGKTLGIVGMGRIGKAVATRGKAFHMKILYHDPSRLNSEEEQEMNAHCTSLDKLLEQSDIISLHTPLIPETYHLISREKIRLLKKDAILINAARGPVIDEEAMIEALENGRIWGAGFDVYEHEPIVHKKLLGMDNVILLPHIGSATTETRQKMALVTAKNLVQALQGEKPDNLI